MENVKVSEFVLRISALWGEQKKRELLYLEALKKDSMGSLRKILAQGHFSALLFQKEIISIYDYFKCLLSDKELGNLTQVSFGNADLMQGISEKEQVVRLLKKNEDAILESYKSLIRQLDQDSETRKVLNEHLNRISEFYEILSRQEGVRSKPVLID